jgi:SpoVK/Ycf46/Vps4 family AAA+-type ATPase
MAELNGLIGLHRVKDNLNNLINVIRVLKVREEMGLAQPDMSLHLVLSGNPGTGKTTVARLLAKIYKELGVVSKGQLVEVDRAGLVEGFVGQTAQKTQEVIDSAIGGVLFIDEAYTLTNKKENGDYGQEAVDTLLKRMEDDRDSFVVIAAGYTEPMEEFLGSNPGLRSRFSKTIEFDDYSADELYQILMSMCESQDFRLTPEADAAVKEHFREMVDEKEEHFANAREVRNFFERCIERQANRLVKDAEIGLGDITTFTIEDVTE